MGWKRSQTPRLALVVFNLGLVGCYSTSLIQDTRVAPRGKGRVALGGGLARTLDRRHDGFVEAAIHLGVAPMLELQAKITNFAGIELGIKRALDATGPVRVSLLGGMQLANIVVDSAYDGGWPNTRAIGGLHAMPLVGFGLGSAVEIVIGPDLQFGLKSGNGHFEPWLGVGGRAAVAFDLSPGLTIIPECSLLVIPLGPPTRPGELNAQNERGLPDSGFAHGDVRGQCGLGLNFGRTYDAAE